MNGVQLCVFTFTTSLLESSTKPIAYISSARREASNLQKTILPLPGGRGEHGFFANWMLDWMLLGQICTRGPLVIDCQRSSYVFISIFCKADVKLSPM